MTFYKNATLTETRLKKLDCCHFVKWTVLIYDVFNPLPSGCNDNGIPKLAIYIS